MSTVGIVGAGSIGTKLACGLGELGHHILLNDTDEQQTRQLSYPAHSKHYLANNCDYVIVTLPTPTDNDGGDPSIVDDALESFHDTTATLILRSTMPPGSTRRLATKHDLPLVYSPEFLRDRADISEFYTPDRIVLAGPREERLAARRLIDVPEIDCNHIIETRDYLPAELGKEAHNAFFATKVSFANQVRAICEREGVDPQTVMDIVTADHRNTDSHLDPLLGPYGGKCLPKDTRALALYAKHHGAETPLLDGTIQMNEHAREQWADVEIAGEWPNIQVQGD